MPKLVIRSLSLLLVIAAGCGDRDEITRYQAPKLETSLASAGKDRMLAAMLLHEGVAWFFKMTGPDDEVKQQAKTFEGLVRSVKFTGGKPEWRLPSGWNQQIESASMRFATIRAPVGKRLLEMTVIQLPAPANEIEDYVLQNVNRWRGQLQLSPITADELGKESKRFEVQGDTVVLVDFAGQLSAGGMGSAPFAPFAGGGPMPDSEPSQPMEEPEAESELQYKTPSGWAAARGNAFSRAAFEVIDGDARVEITISSAGGELLPNVNRWRGQVGLAPFSSEELSKAISSIDLAGGRTGQYVSLAGEQETIFGVVADSNGRTWFVKLKGDAKLAAREKSNFEAFVRSLQLP